MKTFNLKLVRTALILKPLWSFLGLFLDPCSCKSRLSPKTILVLDFHLIGDIILLTPFLKALREAHPGARIVLAAGPWARELLNGGGFVDEIIPFSAPWVKYKQGWKGWQATWYLLKRLRTEPWDMGIEIRGDIRQILLMAFSGAKCRVGFDFTGGRALLTDVVPCDESLVHLASYHKRIAEYLSIWPPGREYLPFLQLTDKERVKLQQIPSYVGIHLGASRPLKKFSKEEALDLVKSVAGSTDLQIVILSDLEDVTFVNRLVASIDPSIKNRLRTWSGSLREFVIMVSRANSFFCMDSGPAHVAAALGIPVTVFFGPTRPGESMPLGKNIKVVENKEISCRPCNQRKCINRSEKACLSGLTRKWRDI